MLISHSNTLQPLLLQDHIQNRSGKIIGDPGSMAESETRWWRKRRIKMAHISIFLRGFDNCCEEESSSA